VTEDRNPRWSAALVPYDGVVFMDGSEQTSKDERRRFCESLLRIPWLPPEIRRAVMGSLGHSLREHNRGIEQAVTTALRVMIDERKEVLRKRRQRPRGGIHERAVEDVAREQGMSAAALKKRLHRNPRAVIDVKGWTDEQVAAAFDVLAASASDKQRQN
jgi:hypothetical protein